MDASGAEDKLDTLIDLHVTFCTEITGKQMMAYLERNQGMSYEQPVSIPTQVFVPKSDAPLNIVEESILLISVHSFFRRLTIKTIIKHYFTVPNKR